MGLDTKCCQFDEWKWICSCLYKQLFVIKFDPTWIDLILYFNWSVENVNGRNGSEEGQFTRVSYKP